MVFQARHFTDLWFPFPRECNNGVNRHLAIAERVRGAGTGRATMNRGWRSRFLSRLRSATAASRVRESNGNVGEEDRFADMTGAGATGVRSAGEKRHISSKSDRYRRYRCSSYLAAGHTRIYKRRERKRELSWYRGITVIARTHDFHISPASQWCISSVWFTYSRDRVIDESFPRRLNVNCTPTTKSLSDRFRRGARINLPGNPTSDREKKRERGVGLTAENIWHREFGLSSEILIGWSRRTVF